MYRCECTISGPLVSYTIVVACFSYHSVLGFIVWLATLFLVCMPSKLLIMWGFFALVTCLFEGMKWWILRSTTFCDGSDLGCSMDTAGAVSIAAACCWFVATLLICASGATKKTGAEEGAGEQEQEVVEDKKEEIAEAPEAPEAALAEAEQGEDQGEDQGEEGDNELEMNA
jgi:hypothetical protein